MLAIILAVFIVLIVVTYVLLMIYDAKHQTDQAPRTDMTICEKHGAFPSKYSFKLTGMTPDPIEQCPFCFEDKYKDASQKFIQVHEKIE